MKFQGPLGAMAAALSVSVMPGMAFADDVKLPNQISWTAYGTTSSGYAQSVGIGQMLKKNYDVGLRVIPGKNDVSRMVPLQQGQTPLCACGMAAYFAAEGALMFGNKSWGPMKLYNMFNNIGDNGQQLVVTNDANVKTVADLKGKRVTWVKGAPALNLNATAFLAFGGLTWDDVQKVVVPGWKQSIEAVINGQADSAWGSTISSAYNKLAASPRGLFWITLPHDDEEAWKRAQAIAPHWSKHMVSQAVDIKNNASGKVPYEGNTFPYPLFVTTSAGTDDLTYGLTKAVMENYEQIKDAGPGMNGYQLKRQNLKWIFPYHPGAIKFYKEKGLWGDAEEKHNQGLLKRQDILAAAWSKMDKSLSDEEFEAQWKKARAKALDDAGLQVPFRD